jgi:hypothetical protein
MDARGAPEDGWKEFVLEGHTTAVRQAGLRQGWTAEAAVAVR